ncbi:MAG: DNA-directed RNA polymerase subunit D [Candidatus Aenigmarchaeota archaeon]|nr:DNA-directed RNA polymerase subunit D [Candidatus Aenigmarchaeota archaeon]
MKIKILEKGENEITFSVDGISVEMANALRRIMISEIPIMAIEDVYFKDNNSALFDEVIAHRLGLIPLKFPPGVFEFRDTCKVCGGKGCPSCQVIFTLEKEGPCTVYSGDLKSNNEEVKPLYDNMPIVKLEEGQKISLEAVAILGIGRTHIKYKAAISSYKNYPVIKIDTKKCDNCGACVSVCPKDVFEKGSNKPKIKNLEACNLCNACVEACGDKKAIEVKGEEDKFIFKVETVSGLPPEEIVLQACDILEKKVKDLQKEL